MGRLRSHLGVLLAIVVGLVGVSGAPQAAADSQVHLDPRNDVTREFGDPPPGGRAGIDVRGVRNTYEDGRLRLSMETVHLRKDGWGAYWTIKTGPETAYALYYENSLRHPYVVFFPEALGPPEPRASGQRPPKTCKDAKATVRGSTVSASVPSRCLQGARVVRVSGVMQDNERNYLIDDSRTRGVHPSTSSNSFGPALRQSRR